MDMPSTRVMLVDGHPVVREGLTRILLESGDFEVVGEAGNGLEAVKIAESLRPDVVIMEVTLAHKNGIDACRDILRLFPEMQIMILTASPSMSMVTAAVATGVDGFIYKHSSREHILNTVRAVASGEYSIPGNLIKRAFAGSISHKVWMNERGVKELTNREREILSLFAQGHSYADIAALRGNKTMTIRNAIYHIQNKLHVRSNQEIVVWATRNGLLDDDWTRPQDVPDEG